MVKVLLARTRQSGTLEEPGVTSVGIVPTPPQSRNEARGFERH
jgi:hypothetical protein